MAEMGIYTITHIPSGRHYVGASSDVQTRWLGHRAALQRGAYRGSSLQQSWDMDGPTAFSFSLVERVASATDLGRREQQWIDTLQPAFNARRIVHRGSSRYVFDEERFWTRVHKSSGCWDWTGCLSTVGYGKVSYEGRSDYAHRVAWIVTYGPIPDGLWVLHACDRRSCCAPHHLFLGTRSENLLDCWRKGRHGSGLAPGPDDWAHLRASRVTRGPEGGAAKLSADVVRQIRDRYSDGELEVDLAAAYGVNRATISSIVLFKSWRHVGGTPAARFQNRANGERKASAKLRAEQVQAMRAAYGDGATIRQLALAYGMHWSTVQDIVLYRCWRHLDPDMPAVAPSGPHKRLDAQRVRAIRARAASGASSVVIAAEFGINRSTVGKIVSRKTWRHID